jgi:hypothetical protein
VPFDTEEEQSTIKERFGGIIPQKPLAYQLQHRQEAQAFTRAENQAYNNQFQMK